MTTFRAKHREADVASRRLNLAFWLAALARYFSYSLACALTLFGISPLIAAYSGAHFASRYLWISLAVGLIPTGIMLLAYSDTRRKMRERSAGEQARALGAEPTRDDHPRDRRYTNLVAEMSAASGNPPPETYIHHQPRRAGQPQPRRTPGRHRPRIRPHRKRRPRPLQPAHRHPARLLHHQRMAEPARAHPHRARSQPLRPARPLQQRTRL